MSERPQNKYIKPYEWEKGQSGNPKGRPKKGKSLAELIDAELTKQGKQDAYVQWLIKAAEKGNMNAISMILDRSHGPVKQSIDINDKSTEHIPDQSDITRDMEEFRTRKQTAQEPRTDDITDKAEQTTTNVQ